MTAAAVASRMVPVAHGNDNAGSIRVPSAVCGIYGLKPTRGLTPIGPVFPELAAGLDSEHVLTRTVRDSALFLDCVAGPEPGGQYRVVRAGTSYLAALNQPLPPQRIGLVTQHPSGGVVDPEIAAAVEHAAVAAAPLRFRAKRLHLLPGRLEIAQLGRVAAFALVDDQPVLQHDNVAVA